MDVDFTPNLPRLLADLAALSNFTEPETPGWTRRFPSAAYLAGRAWLRDRFDQAGLVVHADAGGNLYGARVGLSDTAPILVGSHTDSVYGGGRLDGALGVLGALEAARCLAEAGVALRRPLWVADYLAEEANDFGVSCVGSRALATGLRPEWLARSVGGTTLAAALAAHGGAGSAATAPLLRPGAVAASLELHIEQGPVLERAGASLAAVSGIVGIRRGSFVLSGRADHAGTAPMDLRHDSLAAAAALTLALETRCQAAGCVGTVGRLLVSPNQSNVVPGQVTLTAEVRSLEIATIETVWQEVLADAQAACDRRGVALTLTAQTDTAPAVAPPWLLTLVQQRCSALDPAALTIASGAGHDTSQLSLIAPSAMIFVPSVGGRSHAPEEHTAPEHLALGVAALAAAIVAVDQALSDG